MVLSSILIRERVGYHMIEFINAMSLPPPVVVAVLTVLTLILGCFMEVSALAVLVLPVFLPVINGIGVSPVYFGILFILAAVIGILTPPFGLGLYMVSGMTGMKFGRTARAITPFLIPLFVSIILLLIFPDITLFLPRLLLGNFR